MIGKMSKKAFSILLAMLMLTVNVNITLATHYCGGRAVKTSLAFGQEQISCSLPIGESQSSCEKAMTSLQKKKNCCENRYFSFSNDGEFNHPKVISPNLDFQIVAVISKPFPSNINFSPTETESLTSLAHSPPLIQQDRQVLYQVFRL